MRTSSLERKISTLSEQISAKEQQILVLKNLLEAVPQTFQQLETRLTNRFESELTLRSLEFRETTVAALQQQSISRPDRKPTKATPITIQEAMERFAVRFPKAFPIWRQLFENGRIEYAARPETSLSVRGNRGAEAFRKFLAPYLKGHVLDVGCGPQAMPIYLEGREVHRIAGLDPLPGTDGRRFEFVEGMAEFMPWPDGEFDTVISATSMDHVISLDLAFAEITRVLADDGRFIMWVCFVAGSPRYNPNDDGVKAIDQFHMFHFDREWFDDEMDKYFNKVEEFKLDSQSVFVSFKKKKMSIKKEIILDRAVN